MNAGFGVLQIVYFALLIFKLWALIDAATRPTASFVAADKLTKPGWLIILGLSFAVTLLFRQIIGIFSMISIVATIVYVVDVRPAVSATTPRRDRRY